jgi:hypothetical protein
VQTVVNFFKSVANFFEMAGYVKTYGELKMLGYEDRAAEVKKMLDAYTRS